MEKTIKWILWLAAIGIIVYLGWAFVVAPRMVGAHDTDHRWTDTSSCIANKCGTTEGTKTQTCEYHNGSDDNCSPEKTEYKDGICPTFYHYQNSGNWNERCHRNNGVSHTFPEHVSPTGCPEGFNQVGNSCQKTTPADTRVVKCEIPEKDVIACDPAGQCPTACGMEASEVPDGEGGYKQCDATPACPPAEGVCPTACGKLADYVDDGQGGQKYCPATPLCTGSVAAPAEPTCKDLGGYAPTITSVSRVDTDTVSACFTKPSENADKYLVWYGTNKDNLTWNTVTPGMCVELSGKELVGTHVWLKVAAKSEGCIGNFSETTDP